MYGKHLKYKNLALLFASALTACVPKKATEVSAEWQQKSRTAIEAQCKGRDGWSDVAPPAHVFGNVYMVGTCGIVSLLITSDSGHILIDGATEIAAPSIAENIRKLGFEPSDVRYLLSSHEHIDHAGGLATLKRLSGAKMVAIAAAKVSLESGLSDKTDPQIGSLSAFPGVKIDRVVNDGDSLRVGPLNVTVIASPGHTPGGTSWTWRSCERATCHSFVYADSLSSISSEYYRFSDHPEYVALFRKTIRRIANLSACDILITPHPSQSLFFERLSGVLVLVNQKDCANYAAAAGERLDARLAKETGK